LDYGNGEGWTVIESISSHENVEETGYCLNCERSCSRRFAAVASGARMILTLHYLDGAFLQEIAEILDQPLAR
jgi:DNA-directed RNA polymerase specialized sigma24 family protein